MYSERHKHAMLDIETASSNTNAAVLTIGVLLFDPMLRAMEDEPAIHIIVPFHANKGREITLDTISWWMQQNQEAQFASWVAGRSEEGITLDDMFDVLKGIFDHADHIWANDPDFDCDILKSFMEQHGVKWKWYRKHRSLRTIKAMHDVPHIEQIGSVHNALDDCKYQAEVVRAVYQGRAFPTFGVYDPNLQFSHRTLILPPDDEGRVFVGSTLEQAADALRASQGPEFEDGHDSEGFKGGCERMGHTPDNCPADMPPDVYKAAAAMIFDGEAAPRPVASPPALGAGYGAVEPPAPPSPAESDSAPAVHNPPRPAGHNPVA